MQTVQGRRKVWLTLVFAVALGLALMFLIIPGTLAQEPTPEATAVPTEPPLGDCYGGVLSHAPLHCYALEQAEDGGVISIDGIYMTQPSLYNLTPGVPAESLYIYVTEPQDEVMDDVYEYIYQKLREYAENWPEHVGRGRFFTHSCNSEYSPAYCVKAYVDRSELSGIESYRHYSSGIFAAYGGYALTQVRGGGKDLRTEEGGWASWRQVWPVDGVGGEGNGTGQQETIDGNAEQKDDSKSPEFNVSDIDLTNFPEVDCEVTELVDSFSKHSCRIWKRNPEFSYAGFQPGPQVSFLLKYAHHYYYAKIAPEDVHTLDAAIRESGSFYDDGDYDFTIVPVSYDFEDLWRYAVILDRFALSTGNTVGIRTAWVGTNVNKLGRGGIHIATADGPGLFDMSVGEGKIDWSKARDTVNIMAYDAEAVANALPRLLPLLGIPVDAVGVIRQPRPWPIRNVALFDPELHSLEPQDGDWGLGLPRGVDLITELVSLDVNEAMPKEPFWKWEPDEVPLLGNWIRVDGGNADRRSNVEEPDAGDSTRRGEGDLPDTMDATPLEPSDSGEMRLGSDELLDDTQSVPGDADNSSTPTGETAMPVTGGGLQGFRPGWQALIVVGATALILVTATLTREPAPSDAPPDQIPLGPALANSQYPTEWPIEQFSVLHTWAHHG